MIITRRFVVLSNPRTGSTFVRTALKRLHGYANQKPIRFQRLLLRLGLRGDRGFTELLLANPNAARPRPPNQHAGYAQIPQKHRHKEVVSVVRDPFSHLVSTYHFRWWQKYPPLDAATLARHFPHFPELDFEEFLTLRDLAAGRRLSGTAGNVEVGHRTIRFIQMFFRHPRAALARLDAEYLDSDQFLEDLPPIHFLQTERLNRDLYDFLRQRGYAEERIAFVLEQERLNASTQPESGSAWNEALVERVLRKERLLFRMLRHLGFEYASPLQSNCDSLPPVTPKAS